MNNNNNSMNNFSYVPSAPTMVDTPSDEQLQQQIEQLELNNNTNFEDFLFVQNPPAMQQQHPVQQQPIEQKYPQLVQQPSENDSYLSNILLAPDTSLYSNAGMCIWRCNPNGKGIQFMMRSTPLHSNTNESVLEFIKINKDTSDKNAINTALRAFYLQTGGKLDDDIFTQIEQSWTSDSDRKLFWKKEWKSVMYFYNMSYDYGIVINDEKEQKVNQMDHAKYFWINFDKIFRTICVTGNTLKIKKYSHIMSTFVTGMFLQSEVRQYLQVLHVKNGGKCVKPRNGGQIRSSLSTFNELPKVIRCEFIHPITHRTMFYRWLEMDFLKIEDYQLFMSLISSLFPEIGLNFSCFYTHGKLYHQTNGKIMNVNCDPIFSDLQQLIANQMKQCSICILPTFIINDIFSNQNVVFSKFKKSEVSWIHEIYGKARKGNGHRKYGHKHGHHRRSQSDTSAVTSWKWQFQNSSNVFEDVDVITNNILENAFTSSINHTNYSRGAVRYLVDFHQMTQINQQTNKIRSLRRILKNCNHGNPLNYQQWQFQENDGTWTDFEKPVSIELNQFQSQRNMQNMQNYNNVVFGFTSKIIKIGDYKYSIDVQYMQQKNMQTNKVRNVRQIPVYHQKVTHYKWQFEDDGINAWTDFDDEISQSIDMRFRGSPYVTFLVTMNKKRYEISLSTLLQKNLKTKKRRNIRRVAHDFYSYKNSGSVGKCKWEWFDDDRKWKAFIPQVSKQIDVAFRNGYKKYFFTSKKNSNSYEIHFQSMQQFNVQTGKQRRVRNIPLIPKWKGMGNDPQTFVGPVVCGNEGESVRYRRRTFGNNVLTLYCVVGGRKADAIQRCSKFVDGSLGPFGCGLYFLESAMMAKNVGRSRTSDNRGWLVTCRVFVGKEYDLTQSMDKPFDFQSLQKLGYDSILRRVLNGGREHIIYNYDQICVENVQRYV